VMLEHEALQQLQHRDQNSQAFLNLFCKPS
jgi:hypothetical protein